jgi:AcrR family transcriptional regulator
MGAALLEGTLCERGSDAVTMTEIAEAAEVGRATLFAYFPVKEALVLDRVREDDPCRVFSGPRDARRHLDALTGAVPAPGLQASISELPRALNATLSKSAAAIKDHFHGPVTYASAPWEAVDWSLFDLVSADLGPRRRTTSSPRSQVTILTSQSTSLVQVSVVMTVGRGHLWIG